MEPKSQDRRQSPIVLYVTEVNFSPNDIIQRGERVTVVDIEITREMGVQIISEILKRIVSEKILPAMRIRFSGRLVVS